MTARRRRGDLATAAENRAARSALPKLFEEAQVGFDSLRLHPPP
jgi:hypothetical protein